MTTQAQCYTEGMLSLVYLFTHLSTGTELQREYAILILMCAETADAQLQRGYARQCFNRHGLAAQSYKEAMPFWCRLLLNLRAQSCTEATPVSVADP